MHSTPCVSFSCARPPLAERVGFELGRVRGKLGATIKSLRALEHGGNGDTAEAHALRRTLADARRELIERSASHHAVRRYPPLVRASLSCAPVRNLDKIGRKPAKVGG